MIYVASSWSNDGPLLDDVHAKLRAAGLATYDFRKQGRWWGDDKDRHPIFGRSRTPEGLDAFEYDFALMRGARGAFVVLPAGMSTALEAGWFAGRNLPIVVWGLPREPLDIMWLLCERAEHGELMLGTPLEDACRRMKELFEAAK